MSVQQVLILLWKYLLVKEEELFYWWKVSKFLLAALFANARRVDVSKFRVEKTAILRLRPRKLIFLLFSKIKAFLREQITSDYLSRQKIFMNKKWRKSIFQLLPLNCRYFLTVALNFIDSCQNSVSADQYRLTVSRAQIPTHWVGVFFEVIRCQLLLFKWS